MRWPFRRKGAGSAPEPAARSGGSPAAPARRPSREWATLPPLPVTVASTAPLVIGPAPVLPPLPGRRAVTGSPIAPAAGRVEGMATVLPPRPAPSTVDSTPAPPVPAPPVVHRPARPVPAEVRPLTEAVDEYVGEAREPAEPYRAPAWLRFTPDWLKQGGIPGLDAIAEAPAEPASPVPMMITPPSFIPSEVRSPSPRPEPAVPPASPAALPPPIQEVTASRAAEQPPTVLKRRRANLADSRRLGLGTPTSRPAHEPFVLPSQSQELVLPPADEPAAPVRQAEPAPEPEPEPAPLILEPVDTTEEPPPPPPVAPLPPETPPPAPPVRPVAIERPAPATVVTPTYRATTPTPKPSRARKPLQKAVVVSKPPADLVDALRSTHRADVSEVPVYRGPRVSEAAKARGARAFAAGGAVFLPDEAGPADSPATRGLLAHELVHAVQQRTLGPVLPPASSPEGQALEAEAVAAERWYAGEAGAPEPAPLILAPVPGPMPAPATHVSEVDMSAPAQLAPLAPSPPAAPSTSSSSSTSSPLHAPFDEPTREAVGQIAETSAKRVVEQWTNPALGGSGFSSGDQGSGPSGGRRGRASGAGVATAAAAGAAFDADARRRQLQDDLLAQRQAQQDETGEQGAVELTDADYDRIDQIVEQEAAAHGVSPGSGSKTQTPQRKLSTSERWMAGLTGVTEHDGNMSLSGLWAEHGSEGSWFQKDDDTDRSPEHIAANIGIGSHDQSSLDYHDWLQGSDDKSSVSNADAGAHGPTTMQTQAEKKAHGRPSHEDQPIDLSKLDLDELSARLYDKVRSRLRLELLVDRERSGRLTDFR